MYDQQQYNGQHGGHRGSQQTHSGFSCRPIVLDDYNSDLNFVIGPDGLAGSSLHQNGFEYLWAGVRATHGVSRGKACFEVIVGEKLPVKMPDTERTPHVMRVGWSTDLSNLQVGEDIMSYGYGGTGKSSWNNKFFNYGEPYSTRDVITCYIDLDAKSIFFTKNGHYLGEAFKMHPETNGAVFYPHVTVKNMKFQINFGLQQPYFYPVQGFPMIQHIAPNLLERAIGSPDTRKDCKIIMMVGIPGSGKTFWAEKYAKENKNQKFNIIGTNSIIDKMKVMGLARQRNYSGRWDVLIKQATDILNKVLKIAEKKNRNYIIDQTNVYPRARRRKISNFHGCDCIAAVLVNRDEVLKQRIEKREREEGKLVPEKAIMEMKANFTIPEKDDIFNRIWFIEEDEENSKRLVEKYNSEGKAYLERLSKQSRNPPASAATPENTNDSVNGPRSHVCQPHFPPHGTHGYNTDRESGPQGYGSHVSQGYGPHSSQEYGHHGSQGYGPHSSQGSGPHESQGHAPHSSQGHAPHGSRGHDDHLLRTPFGPTESRPQVDNISGVNRHFPERGAHNMSRHHGMPGSARGRYMPYDSSHRSDSVQYHQHHMPSQQYYGSSVHYSGQYMQDYGNPHGCSRVEQSFLSVEETSQSGCSSYELPLTSNTRPEPVENNEYHGNEGLSNSQQGQYRGNRGNRGYSSQYPYNRRF